MLKVVKEYDELIEMYINIFVCFPTCNYNKFAQEGCVMKLVEDSDELIQICSYIYTYICIYIRTHICIQDGYVMKLVKEYDELIKMEASGVDLRPLDEPFVRCV